MGASRFLVVAQWKSTGSSSQVSGFNITDGCRPFHFTVLFNKLVQLWYQEHKVHSMVILKSKKER